MEMAQMHGTFQQQHMARMQHASSLGGGPYGGNYGTQQAENAVGGAMNTAAAIGSPMMGFGASTIGSNMLMGGVMGGSLAGGILGAGAVAGGAMAAGYVGNQMFTGAQQQQRFNTSMRANYRFANAQGGQGFSRSGMGDIGDTMRQMSTQQGAAGEMVGFEELGRLANNMGRMGMAQGVRDAKDFTQKFKTMVTSLKEIATEMGTSMEEAQKMMGAMKGSGVFGAKNVAGVAKQIRAGSVTGGLATSELTGMQNIGSQISRSVGGLGKAGGQAGIKAITDIGQAVQSGSLSEEDIYNSTGLTGAQGRRAMATNQLAGEAKFWKSGLGRRALAAMAGKGGTLDEGSAEAFEAGGVSVNETRQMWGKNLSKVGRADFIRNEGRLRGAAMERFGGLGQIKVLKQWGEGKGLDFDSDRGKIWLQRRMGKGRDEVDSLLKQLEGEPLAKRRAATASEDDQMSKKLSARQSTSGVAGVKQKLEKARAQINAGLQQVGADFYQEMSDMVEGTINKLTGNYVKEFHKSVAGDFRTAMRGGVQGDAVFQRAFGGTKSVFGATGDTKRLATELGLRKGIGSEEDITAFKSQDADRFAKAGYSNMGSTTAELRKNLGDIEGVSNAFNTFGRGMEGRGGVAALGKEASQSIKEALQYGKVKGKGFDRLASMGVMLGDLAAKKGGKYADLKKRYEGAGREEKAQIMASLTGGAGVEGESSMFASPDSMSVFGGSKFGTVGEKHLAIGEAMGGKSADTSFSSKFKKGAAKGFLFGGAVGAVAGGLAQGIFGGDETASGQLTDKQATAAGAFMESDEGSKLGAQALSMDADVRESTADTISARMSELSRKGGKSLEELGRGERGEYEAMRSLSFAQKLGSLSGKEREDKVKELAELNDLSPAEVEKRTSGAKATVHTRKAQNRREAIERFGSNARTERARMRRSGLISRGEDGAFKVSDDIMEKFGGEDSAAGKALAAFTRQTTAMAEGDLAGTKAAGAELSESTAGMSDDEREKFMENLRTTGGTEGLSAQTEYESSIKKRLDKGRKKRAGGTSLEALAGTLGSKLSAKDIRKMLHGGEGNDLTKKGGLSDVANALAKDIGLDTGSDAMGGLKEAVKAMQSGDTGAATKAIATLQGSDDYQKAKRGKAVAAQEAENPLDADRNKLLKDMSKAVTDAIKNQTSILTTAIELKPPEE